MNEDYRGFKQEQALRDNKQQEQQSFIEQLQNIINLNVQCKIKDYEYVLIGMLVGKQYCSDAYNQQVQKCQFQKLLADSVDLFKQLTQLLEAQIIKQNNLYNIYEEFLIEYKTITDVSLFIQQQVDLQLAMMESEDRHLNDIIEKQKSPIKNKLDKKYFHEFNLLDDEEVKDELRDNPLQQNFIENEQQENLQKVAIKQPHNILENPNSNKQNPNQNKDYIPNQNKDYIPNLSKEYIPNQNKQYIPQQENFNLQNQQNPNENKDYIPNQKKDYIPNQNKGYIPNQNKGYIPNQNKDYIPQQIKSEYNKELNKNFKQQQVFEKCQQQPQNQQANNMSQQQKNNPHQNFNLIDLEDENQKKNYYDINNSLEDENKYILDVILAQDLRERDFIQQNQDYLSMQFIQDLQNEERILIEMRKKIEQEKSQDCAICLDSLLEGFWLLECGHVFHMECLKHHFQSSIKDRKFPICCPSEKCQIEVTQEDMKLVLNEEYLTKFNQYTFQKFVDQNAADMSWCPTPGCGFVFAYDDRVTQLNCQVCGKVYCLKCKVLYHNGSTCEQYQQDKKDQELWIKDDEKMFQEYVKGQKFKLCSKCQFWVQRSEGCDHMTCRCGYQFCYKCGGQYGNCECKKNKRK